MPKRSRSAANAPDETHAAAAASSTNVDAAAMDIDAIDSSTPVAAAAVLSTAPPSCRSGRAAKSAQLINFAPAASAERAEGKPKRKRAKKPEVDEEEKHEEGEELEAEEEADEGKAKKAKRKAAASTPSRKKKTKQTTGEAENEAMADVSRSFTSSRPFTCDSNSLSVVLSFLNMRDFLSSTRVSRQWRVVSGMHTAWPKQSIESLISSLQADRCDDPNVRRLRIQPIPRFDLRFDMARLLQSRAFSQINDISFTAWRASDKKLWDRSVTARDRSTVQSALLDLVKFPYLQTLNICTTRDHLREPDPRPNQPDDDFVERFSKAMGGKLRALFLNTPSDIGWTGTASPFEPHLHQFAHLRVLVVDDVISGDALWQLPQLEFFHGIWTPCGHSSMPLVDVIRTMSVDRSLRGVSLLRRGGWDQGDNLIRTLCALPLEPASMVVPPPATFQPTSKPAELTTLTVRGEPLATEDLMLAAEHLTQLKHLDVEWEPSGKVAWDARLGLPQLETLKLHLNLYLALPAFDFMPQPLLPTCPRLTTFWLTTEFRRYSPSFLSMSRTRLVSLVTTSFPKIEHLRIGDWKPTDEPQASATAAASAPSAAPAAAAAAAASSNRPSRTAASSPSHKEDVHEAQAVAKEEASFRRLGACCSHLRTIDLDILPQADIRHLLPMIIHQLADFHTLEVTCHPPSAARRRSAGGTFSLPAELYVAIASRPTFRTLRVHLSRIQCDSYDEADNAWSPDDNRRADPLAVTQIVNAAAQLQPLAGEGETIVTEEVMRRRLAAFRLFRHSECTRGRESMVEVFGLQPMDGQPDRLRWVWRKDERDD